LSAFSLFPAPAQERERYFLKNSVSGFLGWLKKGELGGGKVE